jgi:hypothetical protein
MIMLRSALICMASRAGGASVTARGSRRGATPRTGAQGRPLPRRGRGGSSASRCKVAPTSSPASLSLPGQSAHPCTNRSANARDSAIPRGPRRAASWPLQLGPSLPPHAAPAAPAPTPPAQLPPRRRRPTPRGPRRASPSLPVRCKAILAGGGAWGRGTHEKWGGEPI